MAKRAGAGFGLSAIGAPVAASLVGNPVDRELAEFLRQTRQMAAVRQLQRLGQEESGPAAPQGPVPAPSTLTEAVQAATSIATLHKGAAEVAMAERQLAEERAARIGAEVEDRVNQARVHEQSQGALVLTLVQQFAQAAQENLKSSYESQLRMQERIAAAEAKGTESRLEGLLTRFEELNRQKDEKIAQLEGTVRSLSGRETVEERLTRLLIEGKQDDPMLALIAKLAGPQTAAADDPNMLYQRGIAEIEVEKARRGLVETDLALRHKDEKHQEILGLVREFRGVLGAAHDWIPAFLGGLQQRGDSRNGVPAGFPAHYGAEGEGAIVG